MPYFKNFHIKKRIIFAAAGIALFSAVFVTLAYALAPSLFLSDKMIVRKGLKHLTEDVSALKEDSFFTYLGVKELSQAMLENPMELNGDLMLDRVPDGYSSYLEGIGLIFDFILNTPQKEASLTASAKYGGAKLIEANLYTDNQNIYFSLPELLETSIFIDAAETGKSFKNSALSEWLPFCLSDSLSLRLFRQETADDGFSLKTSKKLFAGDLFELYQTMSVEKTKQTKAFTLHGKTVSGRAYVITLDSKTVSSITSNLLALLQNQEFLKQFPDEQKNLISSYLNDFEIYLTALTSSPLQFTFYLDSKCSLLEIEFSNQFSAFTDNDTCNLIISFKGQENPVDSLEIFFQNSFGSDEYKFTLQRSQAAPASLHTVDSTYTISLPNQPACTLSSYFEYDKTSGLYQKEITYADSSLEPLILTSEGAVTNLKKGSSFTIEADDLSVTSFGKKSRFSGSLQIAITEKAPVKPSGEARDLFSMEFIDLLKLTKGLTSGYTKFLKKISF